MRCWIRQLVVQILLERRSDPRIAGAVNRVFQITRKRCDMWVINAGIGGNLIGRQFTTLPGTVERVLQDGSFANQIVQCAQGVFGCHIILTLRLLVLERKPKKSSGRSSTRATQFDSRSPNSRASRAE